MTQPSLLDLNPQPRANPVRAEIDRLNRNEARCLDLLSDGLWHSNMDLVYVGGIRAIGRLHALKAKGYEIAKRHVEGGRWDYRLVVK